MWCLITVIAGVEEGGGKKLCGKETGPVIHSITEILIKSIPL